MEEPKLIIRKEKKSLCMSRRIASNVEQRLAEKRRREEQEGT